MKIIVALVLFIALAQASRDNYQIDDGRELRSSGGGRGGGGGRSGGRSGSSGRGSGSGGSAVWSGYRGYTNGVSNNGYMSFGNHAYASYYAYAYYGEEDGRHDCWDKDLECKEDAKKRNLDTGLLTFGIIMLFPLCCAVYFCFYCYKQKSHCFKMCAKKNVQRDEV
jgi:hypothetical protein